jgi:ornithine decarboxylase
MFLQAWCAAMPRVVPFYAIKCNPDPGMVRLLAALGAGFDCASLGEVQQVLDLGVSPSRIIFAHPCKRPCDIRYAREHGVGLTTFDTESELVKIANFFPGFKCVLRIRADDPEARVPLGLKYGANPEEAPKLLATAQRLGLDVVGVSFHVGSACKNLAAYSSAIEKAREVGGSRCCCCDAAGMLQCVQVLNRWCCCSYGLLLQLSSDGAAAPLLALVAEL